MKKAKILAVFGILLAMGITACNNGGESGGDKQSQQETPTSQQQGGGDTSAEHKHSFGKWTETKAPTCTEKGIEERVCECGEKETREKDALGHDFEHGTVVENSDTSTCTEDGKQTIKCARCNATKEVDVKAHHRFGAEQDVAASEADGTMAYKKAVCSVDSAVQLKIRALDGTITGSVKDGTPEGYFKLTSNGNKVTFKIKVEVPTGKDGYSGILYQRGAMDNFNNGNSKRKYTDGGNGTRNGCNFEVKVNGTAINMDAYKSIPIDEMSAGGEDLLGEAYSPVTNCPIGQVVLKNGVNEIVYERLGSYNLAVSDFIFQGAEFVHSHQNATTWSKDEKQHWHACVAPGCPDANYKADAADHTFGDPYDKVEATCSQKGSYKQKCSVCEYVKTVEVAQLAHDYTAVLSENAAGEGYIATQLLGCGHNCGANTILKWSALDYDATKTTEKSESGKGVKQGNKEGSIDFDDSSCQNDNKDETKLGTHIVYKVNVPTAVENAGLAMLITKRDTSDPMNKQSQDNRKGYYKDAQGEWQTPESRYGLMIDGVEYMIGKYEGSEKSDSNVKKWFEFPVSFNLTAGVHEIELFKYFGYKTDHYAFAITGLAKAPVHHLGDWVATDDDVHYKTCTDAGCESASVRFEVAPHEWDEGVVVTPATCSAKGTKKVTCKVCGKEKIIESDKLPHTWGEGQTKIGSAVPHECTVCHAMCYELDFADTTNSVAAQKLKKDAKWNIEGLPAGTYEIQIYACAAATTLPQAFLDGGTGRYQWRVDSGDYVNPTAGTYADFGLGTGEKAENCQWSKVCNTIAVGEGAKVFEMHWTNKGYSAFISAVRLVKVA